MLRNNVRHYSRMQHLYSIGVLYIFLVIFTHLHSSKHCSGDLVI